MSARRMKGHWWVDIHMERKRIRWRSPDDTKKGAVAYEQQLRQRTAQGLPLRPLKQQLEKQQPLFSDFAWRWYRIHAETNNKPSVQKSKRLILQKHLVPFFGKLTLDNITTLKVEEFKAKKLKEKLAPKTINNFLAVLAKCLRCAEEWGELNRVPKLKLLNVPPQAFTFLSSEEIARLIQGEQDKRWRAMLIVALHTGLRMGELIALGWTDVNLETRILTVRRSAYGKHIASPKSNRIRYIPLTGDAEMALRAIQRSSGLVFSLREDGPLNEKMPRLMIRQLCQKTGVRRIGFHGLRHTFASQLVAAGVNIKAVQELLGHSDIRTTMRYSHLGPSVLQDAVRVLKLNPPQTETFGHQLGTTLIAKEMPKLKTTGMSSHF